MSDRLKRAAEAAADHLHEGYHASVARGCNADANKPCPVEIELSAALADEKPVEVVHCLKCDAYAESDPCPGISAAPAFVPWMLEEARFLLSCWRVDQPRQIPLVQRTIQLEQAMEKVGVSLGDGTDDGRLPRG